MIKRTSKNTIKKDFYTENLYCLTCQSNPQNQTKRKPKVSRNRISNIFLTSVQIKQQTPIKKLYCKSVQSSVTSIFHALVTGRQLQPHSPSCRCPCPRGDVPRQPVWWCTPWAQSERSPAGPTSLWGQQGITGGKAAQRGHVWDSRGTHSTRGAHSSTEHLTQRTLSHISRLSCRLFDLPFPSSQNGHGRSESSPDKCRLEKRISEGERKEELQNKGES